MSDFREYLAREFENPDFKREWDAQESERWEARADIGERIAEEATRREPGTSGCH